MRKWTRRVLLGAAALLGLALTSGVVYERWSRWSVARHYPAPGQLIELDGARSHLRCIGEGSPTVVLEAGLDIAGSLAWRTVHRDISSTTRVCAYDRAGIMWSDPRPPPRDAHHITDELHALLAAASEPPPYVMVGHSIGGVLIRVFDHRFPGEVVGFVLVDSSHPEMSERVPPEVTALAEGLPSAFLEKLLAETGVTRWMESDSRGPVRAFLPRSLPAFLEEEEASHQMLAQARSTGTLGDRPLVVLSGGRRSPIPELTAEVQAELFDVIAEMQAELAALSTNADHRTSPRAGHYLQMDDPMAVITAVEDVVAATRAARPVRKVQ